MRPLYFFILFLLCGNLALASVPMHHPALHVDTGSMVQLRQFDQAYLKQLSKQKEFQYTEEVENPSWFARLMRWFWNWYDNIKIRPDSGTMDYFLVFLKYLFIVLGVSAILFIILRVAGVDVSGIFKRKAPNAALAYAETLENIHEINFDADIEEAVNTQNYRLAVRLYYLKSLKQLSDAGLIHWQPDKTNTAYINELQNMNLREAFTVLTRQFEFIWYGDFDINAQSFQNIKTLFGHFKQTMQ